MATPPLDDPYREAESPAEALAAALADAMASAWGRGERVRAEDLMAAHPEVAGCPEAAVRLIYEEVLLRRELGDEPSPAELRARFPRWHDELAMLLACDRLVNEAPGGHSLAVGLGLGDATASWPASGAGSRPDVGSRLGGFRLLARLGSGALGHTFLATDPDLGDRPVVLKLTPRGLDEHVSLARLQHTHIVPLYAAPEFPGHDLRALCMPYLGGASLDRVLDDLRARPGERPDGRAIVEAVDRAQEGLPVAVESAGPARRPLATLPYPEAVAWIAVCLADALHAAHGRGLVHMDVKPANVLIAADGTPMLLDFHLARPPVEAGAPPPGSIGGTPIMMAPEQRAAMEALAAGRPIPARVDGRADVYALGRLIDSALDVPGGREAASPGLRAIVARCLEADPARRYPDAAGLGDDLRRHLNDLPLRGVPDRSPAERWAKWRRRSPQALPRSALLGLAAAAALALVVQFRRVHDDAASDLIKAHGAISLGRFDEAVRIADGGLGRLRRWPGQASLRRSLAEARDLARRGHVLDDVHELVDRLRFAGLGGASPSRLGQLRDVRARLRDALDARGGLGFADPTAPGRAADDLRDFALLAADLGVRLAKGEPAREAAHREALTILDEAEARLGPGRALAEARRSHAEALGLADLAREAARRAGAFEPATASEFHSAGLARLQAGDRPGAIDAFGRALRLDPRHFWALYHRGIASFGLGRFNDARADFHACVTLAPDKAECFYNRALALDALDRPGPALADLDRALELARGFADAALQAGLIRYRLGRHDAAEASLRRALALGADPKIARYNLALVRLARGDRSGAIEDLDAAGDLPRARGLLDQLRRPAGR